MKPKSKDHVSRARQARIASLMRKIASDLGLPLACAGRACRRARRCLHAVGRPRRAPPVRVELSHAEEAMIGDGLPPCMVAVWPQIGRPLLAEIERHVLSKRS